MEESKLVFAKQLRRNMTDTELLLWRFLRGHRLQGAKFKRQQQLGNYIVDFVCFEARLVVEVDGGQHLDSEQDRRRDTWLRDQGFEVLRFWNNEVLEQTEAVLERIFGKLSPSLPLPGPLPRGERGRKSLERARWRCRRGLLELDIVLGRFIEKFYAGMDKAQQAAFEALLDMPDTELWDMIAGKMPAPQDSEHCVVLELIKAA